MTADNRLATMFAACALLTACERALPAVPKRVDGGRTFEDAELAADGSLDADSRPDAAAKAAGISKLSSAVVAHGGVVGVHGPGLGRVTRVQVGGVLQPFERVAADQLLVGPIEDATPLGPQRMRVRLEHFGWVEADVTIIRLLLSEVEADTPGVDDEEFLEVAIFGAKASTPLDGYALQLLDGHDAEPYRTVSLEGAAGPRRYLSVGGPEADGRRFEGLRNQVQNGPDAVALVQLQPTNALADVVLDGLVYGAPSVEQRAALFGRLGLRPVAHVVDEDAQGDAAHHSMQRCGVDRLDPQAWQVTSPTPNARNTCTAGPRSGQ